jgi:hypothetical protein
MVVFGKGADSFFLWKNIWHQIGAKKTPQNIKPGI